MVPSRATIMPMMTCSGVNVPSVSVVLNDGFLPKGVTEKVEKVPAPPPWADSRGGRNHR